MSFTNLLTKELKQSILTQRNILQYDFNQWLDYVEETDDLEFVLVYNTLHQYPTIRPREEALHQIGDLTLGFLAYKTIQEKGLFASIVHLLDNQPEMEPADPVVFQEDICAFLEIYNEQTKSWELANHLSMTYPKFHQHQYSPLNIPSMPQIKPMLKGKGERVTDLSPALNIIIRQQNAQDIYEAITGDQLTHLADCNIQQFATLNQLEVIIQNLLNEIKLPYEVRFHDTLKMPLVYWFA